VAFGAIAVASVLKLTNQMALVLPVTVVCAILLLRTRTKYEYPGGRRHRPCSPWGLWPLATF
jgi:zinc transport system permease protein